MNQGRPGFIPWSEGDGTSIMLPPVSHTSPHPAVVLYPGTLTGNPTSTPCVTTTTPGITTATSTTTTTTATSTTPSEAKAASIAMSFASAPMPSPHVPVSYTNRFQTYIYTSILLYRYLYVTI